VNNDELVHADLDLLDMITIM